MNEYVEMEFRIGLTLAGLQTSGESAADNIMTNQCSVS